MACLNGVCWKRILNNTKRQDFTRTMTRWKSIIIANCEAVRCRVWELTLWVPLQIKKKRKDWLFIYYASPRPSRKSCHTFSIYAKWSHCRVESPCHFLATMTTWSSQKVHREFFTATRGFKLVLFTWILRIRKANKDKILIGIIFNF